MPATLDSSLLARFVLLSMLFHMLVLLVFGTAPGVPGARRGNSAWGGFDVTLRLLTPEPGSEVKLAPGEETTSPGSAILRRVGGAPTRPAPEKSPTTVPPPQPQPSTVMPEAPSPPPAELTLPPPTSPPESAARTPPESSAPQQPSSFETLPPLNRTAPEIVDQPFAPAVTMPAPKAEIPLPSPPERKPSESPALPTLPVAPTIEQPVAPPNEQRVSPPIEQRGSPPLEAPVREAPTRPTPPAVELTATPKSDAAPVIEAPSREVPVPPKVIEPIAPPREVPVVPAPKAIEPSVAPREVPVPVAPQATEPAAAPKAEQEIAPAVEPAREPAPAPAERVAPQRVEPRIAPPIESPAPRHAPVDTRAPGASSSPQIENAIPPAVAPGKASMPSTPARNDAPTGEPPRLRYGAPDAADEIFKPRVNPEQNTPPRLDLEATRQRAREIASDGSAYRGVAPVIPAPPPIERKSKLAEAIDKAQKPDCRNAYADMGLLAVVPLVASTVADGNGGCRW